MNTIEQSNPSVRGQRGHTLMSLIIATTIGAAVIAGGWSVYRDMAIQWKVANVDRMMDQYAQSAMKDLTNYLSWSWGAVEIQGGPRATRWKLLMQDVIEENGSFSTWQRDHPREPGGFSTGGGFTTLTFAPTRGILWGGGQPVWAGTRTIPWFQWVGGPTRPGEIRNMDRRDRMTMEVLLMDFNPFSRFPIPGGDVVEATRRQGIVDVQVVMHYDYRGGGVFGAHGLYGDRYRRERVYRTQVALRNWDVDGNLFRADLMERVGGG